MNNLQLVEKVLYFIDENIQDNITYEKIASVFGYSSFHFHKIFLSVTGQTVTDYAKKRRLTIAHQKLCETQEKVADICYEVGFNSIQTFNRAFKETFGMQPLQARERKVKITYRDVKTMIKGYTKRLILEGDYTMEPRFVKREEFVIAGYRKHTKEGFEMIGQSWYELKNIMNVIERKNENVMYGFEDYSEDFNADLLAFYYMAAVEVEKDAKLPDGMYRKVVPEATYAVFTVNGNNANGEIGKAFQYIYNVWLPNSEYCIDEKLLADFEYYDERWDCQTQAAQLEIYVPVRKLEE